MRVHIDVCIDRDEKLFLRNNLYTNYVKFKQFEYKTFNSELNRMIKLLGTLYTGTLLRKQGRRRLGIRNIFFVESELRKHGMTKQQRHYSFNLSRNTVIRY